MAVNGPDPKVPKAVIDGEQTAARGALSWSGKKGVAGLDRIIWGDCIIWGDHTIWGD